MGEPSDDDLKIADRCVWSAPVKWPDGLESEAVDWVAQHLADAREAGRAEEREKGDAYGDGYSTGADDERKLVVAYLRGAAKGAHGPLGQQSGAAHWATRIENEDHAQQQKWLGEG